MRKRVFITGVLVPVLVLICGLAYFANQNRRIQAQLEDVIAKSQAAKPVTVQFAVAVPADTPKNQLIYLSGGVPSLGNWDAAGLALQPQSDGKWHGSAQVLSGIGYGYKVTRGTWGTVETDEKGDSISDRTLLVSDSQTVQASVADWIDHGQSIPGRVTLTGDIRVIKNFHSDLLNNDRTLIIYLPPGYDQHPDQRYPVIYMQDGQNLFDESTSYAGIEWQMDEAAQKLIGGEEVNPFIIVGIYNTPQRDAEFTPPALASDSTAHGDLYARFLVESVKPWIDKTYRTDADRANTLIGGSSKGGLIALYTAQTHPEVFGQIMVLSPWLRLDDRKFVPLFVGDGKWLKNERIYATMDGDPGGNGTYYPGGAPAASADGKEFSTALQSAGLTPGENFLFTEFPQGHNDESSFQVEIEPALKWIFKK